MHSLTYTYKRIQTNTNGCTHTLTHTNKRIHIHTKEHTHGKKHKSRENGFDSIPASIYWAIVTLTTVGYGDIAPQTVLGQTLASIIIIIGYAIIAVPTGIVGAEIAKTSTKYNTQACPSCSLEGHDDNAKHCKFCGGSL